MKVAVLVDDYFEEAEFTGPIQALRNEGYELDVIATSSGTVQGLNHIDLGGTHRVTKVIDDVRIDEYDALILPGGAVNADTLRMNDKARMWIKKFMDMRKPIAAICHAPWVLASSGVLKGRTITSFFSIQDDMRNAGAHWVDKEVVVDDNLITSRNPGDIPAFNKAILEKLQTA